LTGFVDLTGLSGLVDRRGLVCLVDLADSFSVVDLVRPVVLAVLGALAESPGLVDLVRLADLSVSDGRCLPFFDLGLEALAAFPFSSFLFEDFALALPRLALLGFAFFGGEEIGTAMLAGSFSGAAVALSGAALPGAGLCSGFCSTFSSFSSFFTCLQTPPRSSERNNPWLVPAYIVAGSESD